MEERRERGYFITASKFLNQLDDVDSKHSFKRCIARVTRDHDQKLGKMYRKFWFIARAVDS